MSTVLRGIVETIGVVAVVALMVFLWLRQRRLVRERDELLERERQAVKAAERANADLQTFLYTVSHDLKSPLFALFGYLDLLRLEGGERLGDMTSYVERMSAAADYMQRLVNDLLLLSRIGRMDGRAEHVDLASVTTDIAHELRHAHPDARFDVRDLPVAHMSATRAQQLMASLLENAVRHAGRDDVTVRVSAERRPDGSALVVVADDGRGVPDEHRERVFAVFERLDGGRDDGTGVGLSACRKIVEHLGGTIRLGDSPTGARVEIELPAAAVRWQPAKVGAGA